MAIDSKPIRNLVDLKQVVKPLVDDIVASPGAYSTATNPLVRPIYETWEKIQTDPNADPALVEALQTPEHFIRAVAPKDSKVTEGQMARGLRHRVGMFVTTEVEEPAIQTIYKKGRFAGNRQPPIGEDWKKVESDDWSDKYVHRSVLEEIDTPQTLRFWDNGFHATTSAALPGIERRKAVVSSSTIRQSEDHLLTGEVFGSNNSHREVFVFTDKIADGYGVPGWFGEFGVVLGVSIEKQRETLARQGKQFGMWSSSDGAQIGDEVPLDNVTVISAPASKLGEVKKWASKNCPHAQVVSREALHLKFGK